MTGPETDLARIEAALADGRASAEDPHERERQELALALRADSPEPAPAFAAELDRRVAAGFPKPRSKRGRLALPSFWIPALAAASLLIVAVVGAPSPLGGHPPPGATLHRYPPTPPKNPPQPAPGGPRTGGPPTGPR